MNLCNLQLGFSGGLSKHVHWVGIGPLSKILAVKIKIKSAADWTTMTVQAVFVLFVVYRQNHVLTVLPNVFSDT